MSVLARVLLTISICAELLFTAALTVVAIGRLAPGLGFAAGGGFVGLLGAGVAAIEALWPGA